MKTILIGSVLLVFASISASGQTTPQKDTTKIPEYSLTLPADKWNVFFQSIRSSPVLTGKQIEDFLAEVGSKMILVKDTTVKKK